MEEWRWGETVTCGSGLKLWLLQTRSLLRCGYWLLPKQEICEKKTKKWSGTMAGWCETQDWINRKGSAFKARLFDQPEPVHFSHDLIVSHLPSFHLGCVSILSVGWLFLFISALVSENWELYCRYWSSVSDTPVVSVCVWTLMTVSSVQLLFYSCHLSMSIHLMLNFEPFLSFCNSPPWHKSIYLHLSIYSRV